jgi:hypothetical protein
MPNDAVTRWCRLILQGLAASFALVGAIFFFAPNGTVRFMTALGAWLGDFTPGPASEQRLWLSLTTGYMVLVTALAYLAQRDLAHSRPYLTLLALGKGTSSLTSLYFYLFAHDAFIYLANFVVDGSIALTVLAIRALVAEAAAPGRAARRAPDPVVTEVLGALADAMVPVGGPFPEGARDTPVAGDVAAFIADAGLVGPRPLRAALRAFDWSPYFLPPFCGARFTHLPLAERVRVLEAWEGSALAPRRLAMHVLKLLVTSHFYARPEIAPRLAYPHPLERVPR